jgi:hypothetical protein
MVATAFSIPRIRHSRDVWTIATPSVAILGVGGILACWRLRRRRSQTILKSVFPAMSLDVAYLAAASAWLAVVYLDNDMGKWGSVVLLASCATVALHLLLIVIGSFVACAPRAD